MLHLALGRSNLRLKFQHQAHHGSARAETRLGRDFSKETQVSLQPLQAMGRGLARCRSARCSAVHSASAALQLEDQILLYLRLDLADLLLALLQVRLKRTSCGLLHHEERPERPGFLTGFRRRLRRGRRPALLLQRRHAPRLLAVFAPTAPPARPPCHRVTTKAASNESESKKAP